MMTNIKTALTPKEVIGLYPALTTSEGTLANWRNKKVGPKYYKLSRKIIYRPEDVEAYLFQNPVMTIDSAR
jgi:hypothetical protein